jgi:hypothetical protein
MLCTLLIPKGYANAKTLNIEFVNVCVYIYIYIVHTRT